MNFLKAKNSFSRNSKDNSSVYSNDETLELTAIDKSISRFPESLGRKVVHLNLSQNKIKDIIVSQDIIGLKTLIVSQNLLSSLPSKLSYLQVLQVLDVSHNKISKLPSKLDLPNLKYLDVSNNNLSSLGRRM
jgi:Leucine-rich repeat (LRR) protein